MRKFYLLALGLVCFTQAFAQYNNKKIEDIPIPFVNNPSSKTIEYKSKAGINDFISLDPEQRYMAYEWEDTLINFTPLELSFLGDINGDGYDDFYYNAGYVGDGDANNPNKGVYKALVVYGGSDLNNLQKTIIRTNLRPVGDINGDNYDDAIGYRDNPLLINTTTWTYYWGSSNGLIKHNTDYSGGIPYPSKIGLDMDGDGYEDMVSGSKIIFTAANVEDYYTYYVPSSKVSSYGPGILYENIDGVTPRLFIHKILDSGGLELIVGKFDVGRNLIFEDTLTIITARDEFWDLRIADIDGDGFKEFLFYDRMNMYYLPKGTGDTLYSTIPVNLINKTINPIGDFNGDGAEDFIYTYYNNYYLTYGNNNIDLACTNSDAINLDHFRAIYRHSFGDINGDGYSDILFESLNDTIIGQRIVVGGNNISYSDISYKRESYEGNIFKQTVNLGDINDDGYDDIAYHSFETGGKSFVYTNSNEQPALILDMDINQRLKRIIGEDINGDGFSDILVLIYNDDIPEASRVNVYLGSTEIDSEIDKVILLIDYYSNNINNYQESTINGIGDINNDGINDFTLSYDDLYIFYGGREVYSSSDLKLDLNQNYCARQIEKLGDTNDDGIDDFAIGPALGGQVNIYYGQGSSATADDYKPVLTLVPDTFSSMHGDFKVFTAGDFNGDGYNDIALIPYIFYPSESNTESLPGLNIFYLGPGADTIPDKLFKIPASPFGFESIDYINKFYGDFRTIPDINGDRCDELFICANVSSKLPIGYAKAGYNGNIYLGGEYLVQDSLPTYQLKGFPYPYSFGTKSPYFYSNFVSAYGDFNNNGIKELMVVDRNKNFSGVSISMFPLGNHSPIDISLSNNTMEGTVASGNEIGVFAVADGDPNDTHTISLTPGSNGNDVDNDKFSVSGNKLLASTELNPGVQTEYKIYIRAQDSFNDKIEKAFIITVSNNTGKDANSNEDILRLYPNPTLDRYNILFGNNQEKKVTILDLNGKIHFNEKTSESKLAVDVSHFSNGIYFIKIQLENEVRSYKFIKQ